MFNKNYTTKFFKPGEKIIFKEYKKWKSLLEIRHYWKRTRRLVYIIKHTKWIVKRHYNQFKKKYASESNYCEEEPIKVIYDLFEVREQKRSSKCKRQPYLTLDINLRKGNFKRGRCCKVIKTPFINTMN